MKLYYSPSSPYARKVLAAAIETGLDDRIELETVDGFGEAHRAANPLGKIPALVVEDGQPALYDSPVICDWLDRQHDGKRLIPTDDPARTETLCLHALGQGVTDAALLLRQEWMRNQKREVPLPPDWWVERQHLAIGHALDRLEAEAADLDGPVDLGRIAVGCALGYLDFRFPDIAWRDGRPGLAGWYAAFAERPSMQRTRPDA